MNWKLIRYIDQFLGIPLLWLLSMIQRKSRGYHHPINDIHSILLIKFWGIGNIFLFLPAVASIKAAHPNARIDFLTLAGNRSVVELLAPGHNIATIDTTNARCFLRSLWQVLSRLRLVGYDIIFDFEQFARFSAIIATCLGGRIRVGFATAGQHRDSLYTIKVPYDNSRHTALSFLNLVQCAGPAKEPAGEPIPLAVKDHYGRRGRNLLTTWGIPSSAFLVVLHVGTSRNFHERRWPSSYFRALADLLIRRHDAWVVYTGLDDEVESTWKTVEHGGHCINMVGKLDFSEFFSFIAAARLIVSADTSAVHIASALHTPVVGLYGPNTPILYGPWGKRGEALTREFPCSPCITNFNAKINVCRHPDGKGACMRAITVAEVYGCVREYFAGTADSAIMERRNTCAN